MTYYYYYYSFGQIFNIKIALRDCSPYLDLFHFVLSFHFFSSSVSFFFSFGSQLRLRLCSVFRSARIK